MNREIKKDIYINICREVNGNINREIEKTHGDNRQIKENT